MVRLVKQELMQGKVISIRQTHLQASSWDGQ